jgi:uncharacterized protein YkwD
MWTPRKTLIVAAAAQMRRHSLAPHLALEETVAQWAQNRVNPQAVAYYRACSERALTRLVNEVSKA